jgi:hypothetical protein
MPDWKRINVERHKLFDGPRKPEADRSPKDARPETSHRAPAIAAGHGIARELRKHVAILEWEIVELEQA